MKKIIGIFIFLTLNSIIIQSCTDHSTEYNEELSFDGKNYTLEEIKEEAKNITEKEFSKLLLKKYNISRVENTTAKSINLTNSKLKNLNSQLIGLSLNETDYQISEYHFNKSTQKLYIAHNIKNTNEYQIIKTNENNGKIKLINNYIIYENQLKSNILLAKQNNLEEQNELNLKYFVTLNEANAEWCQQEKSDHGSSSECQDREYDEFTDSLTGFIAYWSNPTIPILIAAMCSC